MRKSLSTSENTFIFLLVLIISINVSWIITQELKYVRLSNNGLNYTGYLLNRSVLIPALYVVLFNLIYKSKSIAAALLFAFVFAGAELCLNGLARNYHIWTYAQWSYVYDAIFIGLTQIAVFLLHRLFRSSFRPEVKHS
ncbi:hypothetical protein KZ483_00030 [Paenibacillus sp. sptzw28]|uniref:hypothetical protein n=1 Tax=Paenibacillus sp. sptzw28 TaxID=715179 RepID=UPI001C6F0158|nr:hypothetical protein [Paenibacillus sp. sptzw28]QYR21509.1 hypothetical protein KZ483_00030 [Paenibacillus sp. sptzw28]